MNYADIFHADSMVWPLTFLLIALLVLRQVRDEVKPIFSSIVGGVAKSAGSNATAYAIAIMFGLSASLSAFYDVFSQLDAKALTDMSWHQYFSLWAKIGNPFIVAVLAYATQNKFTGGGLSGTNPPLPSPVNPPNP